MPYIDIDPIVEVAPNKINVQYIVLQRFAESEGFIPNCRFVTRTGYYPTDPSGNPIPNPLGFDTFLAKGLTEEVTVNLNDATLYGVLAASEATVRQYIADHPEVPMLAIVDDWLTAVALEYYKVVKGIS